MQLEWTKKQLEDAGFTHVAIEQHQDKVLITLAPPGGDVALINEELQARGVLNGFEYDRLVEATYGEYGAILFGRVRPTVD